MDESMTISDPEAILEDISKKKVKELIPVFVVVSGLLVFGLIGNSSVLAFFLRKAKSNVSCFFIVTLAAVDTLVCLTISLIIMDLSLPYKYTSNAGCKLHTFSKFSTGLASILLLLTIAAYRYRKICRPFKKQLTLKGAIIIVMVGVLVAAVFALPMAFFYEATRMEIPNDYNTTVIGFGCISTRDEEKRKYLTVMNYIFFFLFIVIVIVLSVLYSLQGKVIYGYVKTHARLKHNIGLKESHACRTNVLEDACEDRVSENKSITTISLTNVLESDASKASSLAASKVSRHETETMTQEKKNVNKDIGSSIQVTVMFIIITVGFVVSFTPYLAYAVERSFSISETKIFVSASVGNQFLTNSYLVNSVINPIIYGFAHVEFRQFLRRIVCSWQRDSYIHSGSSQ